MNNKFTLPCDHVTKLLMHSNSFGKDTLWNFSFRAFHEIQFQGHFMKYEILSWNTFTSVSNINRVMFLINKKIVKDIVKRSQRWYRVKNFIEKISCKKFKATETYLNETMIENQGRKSACANIFLEPALTNAGIILEWMHHHAIDHLQFWHSRRSGIHKHPLEVFLKMLFHRKTSVLKSLIYKAARLQDCNFA